MAESEEWQDVNTGSEVTLERGASPSNTGGVWYYTKAAGMGVYNGEYL